VALLALNCTRCGAALRDEPESGVIRCHHCGQNHAFQAPAPPAPSPFAPQPTASLRAWAVPMVAFGVIMMASVVALVVRGSSPSGGSSTGQAASDGPGDATASYAAGEAVDVWWDAKWWPGTIKQVRGNGRYGSGYDGWSSSWDEDETPQRLRRRSAAAVALTDPKPAAAGEVLGDPKATYQAGEVVDIHWGSRWWPGRVVAVKGQGYHVSYDGWASSHDETVDATRLRRR
jgi:hypothetical protein